MLSSGDHLFVWLTDPRILPLPIAISKLYMKTFIYAYTYEYTCTNHFTHAPTHTVGLSDTPLKRLFDSAKASPETHVIPRVLGSFRPSMCCGNLGWSHCKSTISNINNVLFENMLITTFCLLYDM